MARSTTEPGQATGKRSKAPVAKRAAQVAPPAGARGKSSVAADVPPAKGKLVRDSFTIPKDEYLALVALKERASHLRRPTKKSELLRAGVAALGGMSDRAFLAALAKVPSLKTGRPKDAGAGGATSR